MLPEPHPWRYQARCPVKSSAPHKVESVPQDGVRTFLPPSHLAMTRPAITRPARQLYYTSRIGHSGDEKFAGYVALNGGLGVCNRRCCFWSIFGLRDRYRSSKLQRLADPYLSPSNFSNSGSVRIVTPSSLALSYFEPGSVPTTT